MRGGILDCGMRIWEGRERGTYCQLSMVRRLKAWGMKLEVGDQRSESTIPIFFFKSEVRNSKSSACCPLKALSLSKGWILDAGCDY